MKVSVICATIGPLSDVDLLIRSLIRALEHQSAAPDINVEFILVDQSNDSTKHSFPAFSRLHVVHIPNPTRGLSLNRNIGLGYVTGEWIMPIDSDCLISNDYFANFSNLIQTRPDVGHFIGKISAPDSATSLFRNWPHKAQDVSKLMLWYYATSVNSIFRAEENSLRFDERFGLGAPYGSCEDIDFFLRLQRVRLYTPKLRILHPDLSLTSAPRDKLNSYSLGFGALCAKHATSFGVVMLVGSLVKKMLDALRGKSSFIGFGCAAVFRVKGFVGYLFDQTKNNPSGPAV